MFLLFSIPSEPTQVLGPRALRCIFDLFFMSLLSGASLSVGFLISCMNFNLPVGVGGQFVMSLLSGAGLSRVFLFLVWVSVFILGDKSSMSLLSGASLSVGLLISCLGFSFLLRDSFLMRFPPRASLLLAF